MPAFDLETAGLCRRIPGKRPRWHTVLRRPSQSGATHRNKSNWQQTKTRAGALEAESGVARTSEPTVGKPTRSRGITGFPPKQPPQLWVACAGYRPGRQFSAVPLPTKNPEAPKFLTNNFTLPALTIAQIYKCRWQVELFFKWIKQHLRIKAFYGTSENAVKTQIWIAVSVYVLVAIVRKRLGLKVSLYQILQIFSVTLFEKTPILQVLQPPDSQDDLLDFANQLNLFDL